MDDRAATVLWLWDKFEKLLKCILPRIRIAVKLEPIAGLQPIDEARGKWRSTSIDPCFAVTYDGAFHAGWYYLESSILKHAGNTVTKLYYDVGQGMNEATSIQIPCNRRGVINEVFYLPFDVSALRWDPMESTGEFTQADLIIHRISFIESIIHRAGRVFFDLWRFRRQKILVKKRLSLKHILNLSEAYRITAELRMPSAFHISYADFLLLNDSLSTQDKRCIEQGLDDLLRKPLISIIMPVYNPQLDHLRAAVDSVIAQLYPNWELCIADDASTDPRVQDVINEYVGKDKRIRVIFRRVNGHISAASNSALELASGDYIALMDQDDLLPPHALYHVAIEINRYPDACLIYSDEDKVDESGRRFDPYFKPDWNQDLFYSHNLITHLGIYRTDIVREIGGFREGYEGSQDYDLALRFIEKISPAQIRHIPRVLYHWRAHEQSTAASKRGNKLYAYEAAKKALNEHLALKGAYVDNGPWLGSYRARYCIPDPAPLVSLIIPTRDCVDILKACIESIRDKTTYPNWEAIVVDNQSTDPRTLAYFDELRLDGRICVIKYDAPFNYSAINNFAVKHAKGRLIGLVNNDIEVAEDGWLEEMVSHALRPEIGVVGAKLLYPDGSIQHSGVILGLGGLAAHAHRYFDRDSPGYCGHAKLIKNYSALTGACMLVRKELYEKVGGMDDKNLPVAYNDVDFCLKVRELGYRNIYTPYAILYHHESISRGAEDTPEKLARFAAETHYMRERWGDIIDRDPAYNPNLTRSAEDFSLNAGHVKSPHHGYPLSISPARCDL